jgi:hypothetical protein
MRGSTMLFNFLSDLVGDTGILVVLSPLLEREVGLFIYALNAAIFQKPIPKTSRAVCLGKFR